MKFLIAGYGSIGRRHLRNLQALLQKDVALYRTLQSTIADADKPDLVVETDLTRALSNHPDGVIIANPTSRHLDVAIPAAEAGCNLLIEKPISNSMEKIPELKSALERGKAKVLVGFQFRFHPTLQVVSRLLKDHEIGKILSVRAEWGEYLPDWHPWEDYRKSYSSRNDLGGGVVLTLSHPIDYLQWLIGNISSIWAMTGKISDLDIKVEDTAEIALEFSNGALGSLHLDYYRRPPEHKLEIIGTEGTIEWKNATGAARIYRAKTDAWESHLVPEGFDRNDMFLKEMEHFIRVIDGKEEPICTFEDGVKTLEVAMAIHESSKTKKIVHIH